MDDLISRQAAIDAVTDELDMIDHVPQWVFDRLEGRLKQLPPAQLGTNLAEVGTDCISRKSAIERATKEHDFFRGAVTVSDKARRDELLNVMCWLGELPPAQPQRTGKWIRNGWAITCSECGYDMPYTVRNFCPNCGAKMVGVSE